jgi:aryl-alcohol dehydrogenase-like predicted oxidoreductase
MNFGNGDWGIDAETSRDILDSYAGAGGTFLDTAHVYGDGRSEEIVGDFIAADRDHFVVATKYAPTHGKDLMKAGNSRRWMMRAVEDSLRRLKTDHIDLFYLHIWDFTTPLEEVMRGLEDLVAMGKVIYVAASDMPAWQISRANMLADLRGWAPFIGIQVEYNLAARTPERDLIPMADELDLGVVAWAPLAGGKLMPPRSGPREAIRKAQTSPKVEAIARVVAEIAGETGLTPAQVAIAGLRGVDRTGRVLPILGASSVMQLTDNLGYLTATLDDAQITRLDEASAISLGFPHEFLGNNRIRAIVIGKDHDRFDDHRHPRR